jgi:hypothetical protein
MELLQNLGFAKRTLAMGFVPLAMASAYLIRPTEQRLAGTPRAAESPRATGPRTGPRANGGDERSSVD